ncbi:hypothetical protein B0T17DRAFT_511627 [Bombardia bombarda]|uniref:Uncharacterized protein n=1 Tax=Bombardia bombarda TaxID=252184 RepID=A0AA39U729_9PEZI|nr:hypothetical protein B0T17DRAFT_511627 [Bombardia bombarda]
MVGKFHRKLPTIRSPHYDAVVDAITPEIRTTFVIDDILHTCTSKASLSKTLRCINIKHFFYNHIVSLSMAGQKPDSAKLNEISRQAERDMNTYQSKAGRARSAGLEGFGANESAEGKFPGSSIKAGDDIVTNRGYNRRIPTEEGGDVDGARTVNTSHPILPPETLSPTT